MVTLTTHHRIVVSKRGGPDVLRFVEEPLPVPQPGEARVRVEAAGVSAYDVMLRGHRFPGFTKVPYTPGCDVVGVVDDIGGEADGLEPGQRVAAMTGLGNGGYAEFICLPVETLVLVPDGVDPLGLRQAEVTSSGFLDTYLATVRVIGLAVAMLVQPLAGMLSDRNTSRWGRRRRTSSRGRMD